MMYKTVKNITIFILIPIISGGFFLFSAAYGITASEGFTAGKEKTYSALLLYDSLDIMDGKNEKLAKLYDALRTFCHEVRTSDIKAYDYGLIKEMDYVFIDAQGGFGYSRKLDQDLMSYRGTICWVGGGAAEYFSGGTDAGFGIFGHTDDVAELSYVFSNTNGRAERILCGKNLGTPLIEILKPYETEIHGYISKGSTQYPYAVHYRNTWIIALQGTEPLMQLAFYDVLGLLFGKVDLPETRVYVKLDNVSPFIDADKLREVALWLEEEQVPFIMVLTPIFVNYELRQMKEYTDVLRLMQSAGGTAVMGNISGWKPSNSIIQSPDESDSKSSEHPSMPENLISKALEAYLRYDVYPVAFSGTSDMFFAPELKPVLSHFSMIFQSGEWTGNIRTSWLGEEQWKGRFIPDYLTVGGQMQTGTDNYINTVFALKRVKGMESTISYDCFTDMENLKKAITLLKEENIRVSDFRESSSFVDYNHMKISLENGKVSYNGKIVSMEDIRAGQPEEAAGENAEKPDQDTKSELTGINKRVSQIMTFIMVIISIFVLIFLISFILNKRAERRKFMGVK